MIIIQKGDYAQLIRGTLSDRSFVFNVRIYANPETISAPGVEFLARDEVAAQKLFNTIEESSIGISDCWR